MMELLKIVGVAVSAALLCAALRPTRPEMAVVTGLAAGIVLLLMMSGSLGAVIDSLARIADDAGVSMAHFGVVLRVIGMAYLSEFAVSACKDAQETALAAKVEMAGRLAMVVLSLPLLVAVFDAVAGMLP